MSTALSTASRPFLTARWQHLALINYAVHPDRLAPYLPSGLTLDLLDGQAHMSLVAFDFCDTRVLGIPWPGYRRFPEINLRFYVRQGERRGVVFIREYVPKRLIAWIARWLYNEPYAYAPMSSTVSTSNETLEVTHRLEIGGRTQRLQIKAGSHLMQPGPESEAHFFKEHTWGYGRTRSGKLLTYEVRHPVWDIYPVSSIDLDWDFGAVYGPEWADYNAVNPRSVFLAHGSAIAVAPKKVAY